MQRFFSKLRFSSSNVVFPKLCSSVCHSKNLQIFQFSRFFYWHELREMKKEFFSNFWLGIIRSFWSFSLLFPHDTRVLGELSFFNFNQIPSVRQEEQQFILNPTVFWVSSEKILVSKVHLIPCSFKLLGFLRYLKMRN